MSKKTSKKVKNSNKKSFNHKKFWKITGMIILAILPAIALAWRTEPYGKKGANSNKVKTKDLKIYSNPFESDDIKTLDDKVKKNEKYDVYETDDFKLKITQTKMSEIDKNNEELTDDAVRVDFHLGYKSSDKTDPSDERIDLAINNIYYRAGKPIWFEYVPQFENKQSGWSGNYGYNNEPEHAGNGKFHLITFDHKSGEDYFEDGTPYYVASFTTAQYGFNSFNIWSYQDDVSASIKHSLVDAIPDESEKNPNDDLEGDSREGTTEHWLQVQIEGWRPTPNYKWSIAPSEWNKNKNRDSLFERMRLHHNTIHQVQSPGIRRFEMENSSKWGSFDLVFNFRDPTLHTGAHVRDQRKKPYIFYDIRNWFNSKDHDITLYLGNTGVRGIYLYDIDLFLDTSIKWEPDDYWGTESGKVLYTRDETHQDDTLSINMEGIYSTSDKFNQMPRDFTSDKSEFSVPTFKPQSNAVMKYDNDGYLSIVIKDFFWLPKEFTLNKKMDWVTQAYMVTHDNIDGKKDDDGNNIYTPIYNEYDDHGKPIKTSGELDLSDAKAVRSSKYKVSHDGETKIYSLQEGMHNSSQKNRKKWGWKISSDALQTTFLIGYKANANPYYFYITYPPIHLAWTITGVGFAIIFIVMGERAIRRNREKKKNK